MHKLKRYWERLRYARPGERFQELYQQRQRIRRTFWPRLFFVALGGLLIATGIVLMFVPGPGLLVAALGAALIAQESLVAARLLDGAEKRLRKLLGTAKISWQRASPAMRALLVVAALALAAAGAALGISLIS